MPLSTSITGNTHHLALITLTTFCLVSLSACLKNQFSVNITFADSNSVEAFQMVYYASSAKGGRVVEQTITTVEGKIEATGITRYPTVVFLYSSAGRLITAFYAERGDNIKIDAKSDPWTCSGNDITDQWSKWRKKHQSTLSTYSQKDINEAVQKFVKENKDNPLSAILLATEYDGRSDETKYLSLWQSLEKKARPEALLKALGVDSNALVTPEKSQKITTLSFTAPGDSIITIRTAEADRTLLYFWTNADRMHSDMRQMNDYLTHRADSIAKKGAKPENIQVVEVNMQADTIGWRYRLRTDTLSPRKWKHVWAPGGTMHASLETLHIPSLPYSITIDSSGRITHRGTTPLIK